MPPRSIKRRLVIASAILAGVALALFVWNGIDPAWRQPEYGECDVAPQPAPRELRVLAYNIAKASFHGGGLRFRSPEVVRERLDRIAELIRREDPHVVLLSEVVWEAGPSPVNQVRYLAERAGMHAYAYGDNYRFGLPFFRIRSGNAILSRLPLRPVAVRQLAGATPFFAPTGNRRALWCEIEVADETVAVASLRNDSFDLANNTEQALQILEECRSPTLLGGDMNAQPHDPGPLALQRSGLFLPLGEGPPTYPASAPERRIDFVLAPAHWRQVESRTLDTLLSDHLPVLAVYDTAGDE